jgi:hypothetical protein
MRTERLLIALALVIAGSRAAHADPVVINGEWYSSPPIPGDFPNDFAEITVDSFANSPTNEFGGIRYVDQAGTCWMVCPALLNDMACTAADLLYNPADEGWWDVDGNGTCAKFSYRNLTGGRYGNIATFGTFLTSANASGTQRFGHGVYIGISFYAASDNPSDDWTGVPMAQVNLVANLNPTTFGGHSSSLGLFWHAEFPLRWNWTKYYVFFKDLAPPAKNPGATFPDKATAIDFQQSDSENAVTSKFDTGTIYIDHISLLMPWSAM